MVRYLFQRVVQNDKLWTAPTSGRLGTRSDGGYIVTHGFAHEDWNFRRDVCPDGYVYGYIYYKPTKPEGEFNIVFAAYEKSIGWHLAGFYERALFAARGVKFPDRVLRNRAKELDQLDASGYLGAEYKGQSIKQKTKLLAGETNSYRWRVRPENVKPLQVPLSIPAQLTDGFGKYYARPTEISAAQWAQFRLLAKDYESKPPEDDYSDGGELEFPEGKKLQKIHFGRERNKKLVRQAKDAFKKKHGRFYCEACKFDFEEFYGQMGRDFIEAHHDKKPLHAMAEGTLSKISDLAMLCSNCHRIIHRQRPWMLVDEFRRKLHRARVVK